MLQIKLVDSKEYAKREVTITQTTSFLWGVVDVLEDKAKMCEYSSWKPENDYQREKLEERARQFRIMAGEIKRQLVDDLAKEIDKSLDDRTDVSRETIDITKRNEAQQ